MEFFIDGKLLNIENVLPFRSNQIGLHYKKNWKNSYFKWNITLMLVFTIIKRIWRDKLRLQDPEESITGDKYFK